jgi:tetratricopeptide (TPR) repeat protein
MENKVLDDINLKGKTVTFYSYKGGVGRSMSLVNVACLIAKQGKKVLLIDWDLEAPGLHSFFSDNTKKDALGLVDFITDATTFIKEELNNNDEGYLKFLSQNIENYIQKNILIEKSELQLDIIKAGKFDENYTNKLNAIDWINFYKNAPSFFRTFAEFLEVQYDYILIDSRTGLSDTGGVCTMLMPQILVLVFALNNQNLTGVIDVAKQSVNYRFDSNDSRDLTILPLPSRIDNQNSAELEIWIQKYTVSFQNLFKELYLLDECFLENYFNIAKIPYKPTHAYGENIPVLKESTSNDLFISYHYAQFYKLLEDETAIWEILSNEQLQENIIKSREYSERAIEFYNNNELEKAIIEFEKVCELDPKNANAFNNLGNAISKLAELNKDEILLNASIEKYSQAILINPKYDSPIYNWGNTLKFFAKIRKDEYFYEECFRKYEQALKLNPEKAMAFNNWGAALRELAELKKDGKGYEESFKKFEQAILLDPKYEFAFINWGIALSELARLKSNISFYEESFEKYKQAIILNPKNPSTYISWGIALSGLAKLEKNNILYEDSFKKFEEATFLNPNIDLAFGNWGNSLSDLALLRKDESIFKESFEKYKQAIKINPKESKYFNLWGLAVLRLFEITKREELYFEALTLLLNCVSLGGKSYNLACLYSIRGDKVNALKSLEISLQKKEYFPTDVKGDEDWIPFLQDPDFIALLEKYK